MCPRSMTREESAENGKEFAIAANCYQRQDTWLPEQVFCLKISYNSSEQVFCVGVVSKCVENINIQGGKMPEDTHN